MSDDHAPVATLSKSRPALWPTDDDEIEKLREQFYVTLRAYLARIDALKPAPDSPALAQVRQLLAPGRRARWSECYEAEQLLVHLFDDAMLRTELEVRLLEASTNLRPALSGYYEREIHAAGNDPQRQRSLLSRLVNDLQWRYTVQEGKRSFSKSLTTRTGIAFLIALAGFATLVTFAHLQQWKFHVDDLRLLCAAGVSGTWGATFSMLTGLNKRIEDSAIYDLNVMRALTMLLARALVGAGAACVLYLFFSSGMLTGTAFPDLVGGAASAANQYLPQKTVAALVVWCFIAGFSEKLVTGLLARAEGAVEKPSASRSDGAAPTPQVELYRPIETKTVVPGSSA